MTSYDTVSSSRVDPSRRPSWQFASAGQISFGRGCRHQLAGVLRSIGSERPFVVTDSIIAETTTAHELIRGLDSGAYQCSVFDRCQAEPSIEVAAEAIAAARASQADSVIAIGGGSCIDVGKIVATVVKHGGAPEQYFGFGQVPGPTLPVIAIPTTAGTGSEVSHSAVLTDSVAGTKVSTLSPYLRPRFAIVDPELTDSCPGSVTATSGIDALVHAVEAYLNRPFDELEMHDPSQRSYCGHSPLTELYSKEAVTRISRSLVPLVEHLKGVSIVESAEVIHLLRDDMAYAATLAGMAFSNSGVGLVHALEYPIGALTHCGHGEGNGLLLPHVLRFHLNSCRRKFQNLAMWLNPQVDRASDSDVDSNSTMDIAPETAVERVANMVERIGIATRLSQLGMKEEDVDTIAAKAYGIKRLMCLSQQSPSLDDLRHILVAAM